MPLTIIYLESHQHKKNRTIVISNIVNLDNYGSVILCEKSGNYLYGTERLVWRSRLHVR